MIILYSILNILISYLISNKLIPVIITKGIKYKLIDKYEERKIKKNNIVRIGGLGIYFGIIISSICFLIFDKLFFLDLSHNIFTNLLIFSFLFFLIGLLDDLFSLSPFLRLILQFLFSLLFCLNFRIINLDISLFNLDTELIILNKTFVIVMTSIWIVGITNAFNWIDGLDGLASGISLIAFSFLLLLFLNDNNLEFSLFCSSLVGSCFGFFKYNNYPASIYMGDGGSYLLGSSSAILTLLGLTKLTINQDTQIIS